MFLTILVDNFCGRSDLLAEYGFSVHIKCDNNETVLMDTGQGKAIYPNACQLGINLNTINHLVFSHGHFDHIWGAPNLLEKTGNIPVWGHPSFDIPKYRKISDESQYIGSYIKKEDVNFNPILGMTQITENVWGIEVPIERRKKEFMPTTKHLMVKESGQWEVDQFLDDISLVIKGEYGYSVVLGCAHAGVINILDEVAQRLNTKDFYAVIGGMHMAGQSEEYTKNVVEKLVSDYNVQAWIPAHCSGFKAAAMLASKVDNVNWGGTGTGIKL
jgi:7,8-dihydropterin-6-yl-methyl-4-(beta-D-ribofuranosyl)aminobenzene 5'-phosphate synthase